MGNKRSADAIAGIRDIVHAFGFDSNNMDLADLENVLRMFLSSQKMHDHLPRSDTERRAV